MIFIISLSKIPFPLLLSRFKRVSDFLDLREADLLDHCQRGKTNKKNPVLFFFLGAGEEASVSSTEVSKIADSSSGSSINSLKLEDSSGGQLGGGISSSSLKEFRKFN